MIILFVNIKLLANTMKTAILLTACFNRNGKEKEYLRKAYYMIAIHNWLNKTNLPIFIVDSSDYTYPEFHDTRLRVCSFNQNDIDKNYHSSSQYEAHSIIYAMDYFKNELKEYTHIIKITGRYYLNIEEILSNLENEDCDVIVQHQHNDEISWQNSELFGFRNGLQHDILFDRVISKKMLMECALYDVSLNNSYIRLPPIENLHKATRGGDGLTVNPL